MMFEKFIFNILSLLYFVSNKVKKNPNKGSILFVGQSYYNAWYLSRSLRDLGWHADVLNWDPNIENRNRFYHGEDFYFNPHSYRPLFSQLVFYCISIFKYDIFHFSNAHALHYGPLLHDYFQYREYPHICDFFGLLISNRYISVIKKSNNGSKRTNYNEIRLLKRFGKKIVYSNNGCLDGVSRTSFSKWGPESVCNICKWKNNSSVCSDKNNLEWGKIRNELADIQIILGGNRVDYNIDPRIHEVPEFYCLNSNIWKPELEIPNRFKLNTPLNTIILYHAVGNFDERTTDEGINIKCSHIYFPLVERLKKEGYPVQLVFAKNIPNNEVRYIQAQADIFLEMLTYGFFGANVREAMMLGKPVICFLRPEWLAQMHNEIPEYVEELPVISATPENVYDILVDLIKNPEKRRDIGDKSRIFAVKWHSCLSGAKKMDNIYSNLISNGENR